MRADGLWLGGAQGIAGVGRVKHSIKPKRDAALLANQAFAVHAGLLRAECNNPELADNPFWTMLKQDAYERFFTAFKEVGQ